MRTLLVTIIATFGFCAFVNASQEHKSHEISDETSVPMHHEMAAHQQKMEQHMKKMEHILSKIKRTKDTQQWKDLMLQHYEAMDQSLDILRAMLNAKRDKNLECYNEKPTADNKLPCPEIVTHEDTQMYMLLQILEHMLQRQNIFEN